MSDDADNKEIIESLKLALQQAELALQQANERKKMAEKGLLFTPWPEIWETEKIDKTQLKEQFIKVCREKVPDIYKEIVRPIEDRQSKNEFPLQEEIHESPSASLFQQNMIDDSIRSSRKNKRSGKQSGGKAKNRLSERSVQSQSSRQSRSSRKQTSDVAFARSSSSSFSSFRSGFSDRESSTLTGESESIKSTQSQSKIPDFAGVKPSTRAHMIPNIKTSKCFKYYIAICQAVVGIYGKKNKPSRPQLEGLVQRLAESKYNFIRAPYGHGEFFDHLPCWILVPACSLEAIIDWDPSQSYPVLAVANSSGNCTFQDAYQRMCPFDYDDDDGDFEENRFKRSKCKEPEF